MKDSELNRPTKVTTKKGEKDGEGTAKLFGDWQTEAWVPEAVVNGKVSVTAESLVSVDNFSDQLTVRLFCFLFFLDLEKSKFNPFRS